MVKLVSRSLESSDLSFFQELVSDSRKWRTIELKSAELSDYMRQYEEYAGEWRMWEKENRPVAISFHVESAPSNQKPWLGTLLVKASERRKGIGISVINILSAEIKVKGHKAMFAGMPIDEYEWSNFLNDCGFEQFKSEEYKGETYLIMVRPLE
ncbi:GNAT family N-acetyltransferase [Mesobacillus subterraneus]|jgi:N-acetylglutamate synthase-like GNAT family acetyltransferase|uniref:GNAT family N-acetyltransferase n=1 Tax=Mesobacillus subterraneus TaxID=285983 RepID=UPI0020426364|nr:GNAT family N-acetyltransferase [Mesobacillus subterraneus]MCM3665790.1 GNAT family N-acetyltransferase [Mesobacillus subterraneus]MCM3686194.1 GNAT family N-acetyltransferase [Mesobacillus subterraneus]